MGSLEVLDMIIEDTKNDIKELEGQPFNGRNVAKQFGRMSASIVVLAKILKEVTNYDNRKNVEEVEERSA